VRSDGNLMGDDGCDLISNKSAILDTQSFSIVFCEVRLRQFFKTSFCSYLSKVIKTC